MANSQGDRIAFASPRSSTWIVLNCILVVIVLDFCCVSIGDLTRDCLVFLKDRQVSSFGCFVFDFCVLCFEFWVLRFWVLGASFSKFGCLVLRSSFSSASFSKLLCWIATTAVHRFKRDSWCCESCCHCDWCTLKLINAFCGQSLF